MLSLSTNKFLTSMEYLIPHMNSVGTKQKTLGIVVVFGSFLAWTLKLNWSSVPGPIIWPFIGSFKMIHYAVQKKLHDYFYYLSATYGPITRSCSLFGSTKTPTYYIADAAEAKRILTDTDFIRFTSDDSLFKELLKNALFIFSTDDTWKRHRKLLQPAFGPNHLRHASVVTVETMNELDQVLFENKINTISINVHDTLTCVALDVIAKVAFGESLHAVQKKHKKWEDLETITINLLIKRTICPKILWRLFGISDSSSTVINARENVFGYLQRLIDHRRKMIAENSCNQEGWQMDVLHRLVQAKDNDLLTDDEIIGEILGFFFAGHETTANTVTVVLYELTQNLDVKTQLYQEIKDFDLNDQSAFIEKLAKLKYLDNVIKETQRLHPIVNDLRRTSVNDINILGYQLPADTDFLVNVRSIHYNPKYFDDPFTFNPDRFNGPIVPGSFIPFGDGPHNCIGQKMALIEAKLIIIQFLKNYEFELQQGFKPNFISTGTYGLKEGLLLTLKRRQ
ncbi:cytochrome P450 [Globomyces pollinis-pini]|nr:cytochrome P450 [Globomyces pollinis-pini]